MPGSGHWRSSVDELILLNLTEQERRTLAYAAHVQAEAALDARNYFGEFRDGTYTLTAEWNERQERHDRWKEIQNELHPNLWDRS